MIWHATNTNWFEYKSGTRLYYLRFPLKYQKIARDGVPIYFETDGPTSMDDQPPINDKVKRARIREKVEKVLDRRYMLRTGLNIKSLIRYFGVDKGENDIRMVYDATANQLNDAVWVPTFWLPTLDSLLRALDGNSWMADRDIGDMFLNFQLHHSAMPYTGVDLKPLYDMDDQPEFRYAHWDRNLMGFKSSPYNSVKMALISEEVCKGDRKQTGVGNDGNELNPFQWNSVRLNLPGPGYDPSLSWVSKLRQDGRIACDLFTFVDDERVVAPTEDLAWQASHKLAAIQSYLGIIDAARKVRPCSQTPGAWAGAVVHILRMLGVCTLTSEEKWSKMKRILAKWYGRLSNGETELSHSELASDRGFLVYVTRTYPPMVPYLKGFHLAIEMWRGGRDAEGWKLKRSSSDDDDDESIVSASSLSSLDITRAGAHGMNLDIAATHDINAPLDEVEATLAHALKRKTAMEGKYAPKSGLTMTVPRLLQDVKALMALSESDLPVLRVIRPTSVVHAFYGFGDASGKQFGSTVSRAYGCKAKLSENQSDSSGLAFRIGIWTAEQESETSNYKEFGNLVDTVEAEGVSGRLKNAEFFLFTDSSTAESCFHRGSSSVPKLHHLVVRLRKLEMRYGILVHLIHVSGTRMIAQGTDGCSRGFLMEGVMAGQDMFQFVDLGKSAVERHPPLLDWIRSWTSRKDLEPLTPEGWFEEGHGITGGSLDRQGVWIPNHGPKNEMFLWTPPPVAADAALEELAKARHKRTDTYHVVAIPRLMAPRWRRLFNKVCDFSFVVSPGSTFWPADMFEPLWIGILLPFTHHRPWCFKRAPLLVELGRELRPMLLTREADARNLLWKLLQLPKRVAPLSERMACELLHMPWPRPVPYHRDTGRGWKCVAQGGSKKEKTE